MINNSKNNKMRKVINTIYIFFAHIFGLKYQIDSKKYRKEIYRFLSFNDSEYQTQMITYVNAYKQGKETILEIETHRPGLLIGKAGHFIDKLTDFICEETNEKVKIKIKESKIWENLYSIKLP